MKSHILHVICIFSALATTLMAIGCSSSSSSPIIEQSIYIDLSQPCIESSQEDSIVIPQDIIAITQYCGDFWDCGNNCYDIYGYSISSGKASPICTNSSFQSWAAVSGNIVVWADGRNGQIGQDGLPDNLDIYGYNLSSNTEFSICTNSSMQNLPAISGDTVVWTDGRNGNSDIYGYNLATHIEFPVCTAQNDQQSPFIREDMAFWIVDSRIEGGDAYGIYGARLTFDTE